MSPDGHDILTYAKLADGARFFLDGAFLSIHEALTYDYACILFSNRLECIEPSSEDKAISASYTPLQDVIGMLREDIENPLSPATITSMSAAWQESLNIAQAGSHRFFKDHAIGSINILGHLNNLGFFFETLLNRHLLFLRQTKAVDEFSYSRISAARTMERMIYLFKNELNTNTLQLNEISFLFSLRNKTVHFTPDNAKALQPKLSELSRIWNQMHDVLGLFEKKEQFNEEPFSHLLKASAATVESRWT